MRCAFATWLVVGLIIAAQYLKIEVESGVDLEVKTTPIVTYLVDDRSVETQVALEAIKSESEAVDRD